MNDIEADEHSRHRGDGLRKHYLPVDTAHLGIHLLENVPHHRQVTLLHFDLRFEHELGDDAHAIEVPLDVCLELLPSDQDKNKTNPRLVFIVREKLFLDTVMVLPTISQLSGRQIEIFFEHIFRRNLDKCDVVNVTLDFDAQLIFGLVKTFDDIVDEVVVSVLVYKGCLISLHREGISQLVSIDFVESNISVVDLDHRLLQLEAFQVLVGSVHLDSPKLENLIVLELLN